MTHLLVTNDFPPKTGGIQVYLWELWRRLDPQSFAVLTASSHPEAAKFDALHAEDGIVIHRTKSPILLPTPQLAKNIRELASRIGAGLVVIDPALPLGLLGRMIDLPYAVVLHGAEIAIPGRIPVSKEVTSDILRRSRLAICAGEYPEAEVRRICPGGSPRTVVVPPGVETERFRPLAEGDSSHPSAAGAPATAVTAPAVAIAKAEVRQSLGLPPDGPLVVSVSRLVPRKGMDVLIEAAAALVSSYPDLTVAIGGTGRDEQRLRKLTEKTGAPVRFLGRVTDEALPRLYASADVFVMACRDRWGGLEQEGFGIVFIEAAACGIPQVAGRSGGAAEAVVDGETGVVVDDPRDVGAVAKALRGLLADPGLRTSMGAEARRRVVESYDYDQLSFRLAAALREVEG